MRRRHIVALCLAVGALIAAAIAPGVIARRNAPPASPLPPGFTVDRQVTDPTTGSVLTYGHRFRALKPGDKGWVPPPKPGQKGYEGPTP